MELSLETLNVCAVLVSQVSISPTSDDFLAQATRLAEARDELLAALAEASQKGTPHA